MELRESFFFRTKKKNAQIFINFQFDSWSDRLKKHPKWKLKAISTNKSKKNNQPTDRPIPPHAIRDCVYINNIFIYNSRMRSVAIAERAAAHSLVSISQSLFELNLSVPERDLLANV